MFVFVFLIIILLVFYLFYKTKYFRSNRPVEKKWLSSKSNIALGLLVCFFGLNHLIYIAESTVNYVIAVIFILYGAYFAWTGFKKYKHYLPFAIEEAEELDIQN